MKYPVIAQAQAVMDAEEARAEIAARDPERAEKWLSELDEVFQKLAEFPNRFPLAPESPHVSFPVRQILVGRYRVIYAVRGDSVRILRIRHASRRRFKPDELA